MKDIKCNCSKIICQQEDDKLIIKCRHCKRIIIIKTNGIISIDYK